MVETPPLPGERWHNHTPIGVSCENNNDVDVAVDPGAEGEANAIAGLFGVSNIELLIGKDADRLRLEVWHPAFSVLHLATHGVACADDPLSSFIALADIAAAPSKSIRMIGFARAIRAP